MRQLTLGTIRRGRRRAATMMEFVLILPMLLFVTLFTVDMGNVILVNGAMQDTAYSAARAGAQVGGGSLLPNGSYPCGTRSSAGPCTRGASYEAFRAAVDNVPGYTADKLGNVQMRILTGGKCVASATPTRADNHVTVSVEYTQRLMTPGLALLMSVTGSDIDDGRWRMSVTASSRCEVVR